VDASTSNLDTVSNEDAVSEVIASSYTSYSDEVASSSSSDPVTPIQPPKASAEHKPSPRNSRSSCPEARADPRTDHTGKLARSSAVRLAADWACVINTYVSLVKEDQPIRRPVWLETKWAMGEVNEAKDNIVLSVIKDSGVGRAIKRFAKCSMPANADEEARERWRMAKEIYERWMDRGRQSRKGALEWRVGGQVWPLEDNAAE